jgi:hypothetical protein
VVDVQHRQASPGIAPFVNNEIVAQTRYDLLKLYCGDTTKDVTPDVSLSDITMPIFATVQRYTDQRYLASIGKLFHNLTSCLKSRRN